MINIIITRHCAERMSERNIDLEHIKRAVRNAVDNPSLTEATYDGKILTRHEADGNRTLEVIYSSEGFRDKKGYKVVTAYWLE